MTRNTSTSPTISVIVPVYNAEPFLTDCISSILDQTYADFELILVDDGSTDDSAAIITRVAASDPRIVAIYRPNGGLSAARNIGLDAAHGQYITFVDADDMIHPQFLSTLMGMMNPDVDIAACDSVSRQHRLLPRWPQTQTGAVATYEGTEALSEMLYQTSRLRHTAWGKLYRRHLWADLRFPPGWFEDLHISVDLFPAARQIAFTSQPLYFYRRHQGSYLARADASRADAITAAQYVMARCVASHAELYRAASDRLLSASFNLLTMLAAHPCAIDPAIPILCRRLIVTHRRATLLNPRARLKNRAAALLSYVGLLPLLTLKIQRREIIFLYICI